MDLSPETLNLAARAFLLIALFGLVLHVLVRARRQHDVIQTQKFYRPTLDSRSWQERHREHFR